MAVLLGAGFLLLGIALAAFGLNPGRARSIRIVSSRWLWVGLASAAFAFYAFDAVLALRSPDGSARVARDLVLLPIAAVAVAKSGTIGEHLGRVYATEPEGQASGLLFAGGLLVVVVGVLFLTHSIAVDA